MIIHSTCVKKLRIRLENFKGVFTCVSMASDRLYFASLEIDKSYLLTPPPWKNLCHRWSGDQPQPEYLFQRPREEEKRDPGSEVVDHAANQPSCSDDIPFEKVVTSADLSLPDKRRSSRVRHPPTCFLHYDTEL